MPIVTLTTDFGNKDHTAGALKGILLRQNESVRIVDITHNIKPFNIAEAAFVLKNAYTSFPEGTVHINTVNDEDIRVVRYIAARHNNHYFIGFDNGLFAMIFNDQEPETAIELTVPEQNGTAFSQHWKNAFATTAAQLLSGQDISKLGRTITEIKRKVGVFPTIQESVLRGTVIYIDTFQNVIINVSKDVFKRVRQDRDFTIRYRNRTGETINSISESYHDVPQGESLCRFNSAGYLEIAINSGKASSLLGLKVGDYVQIDFQ